MDHPFGTRRRGTGDCVRGGDSFPGRGACLFAAKSQGVIVNANGRSPRDGEPCRFRVESSERLSRGMQPGDCIKSSSGTIFVEALRLLLQRPAVRVPFHELLQPAHPLRRGQGQGFQLVG